MRILHTSDWHLGKTLEGFSRHAEHEEFIDELVDAAEDCDLVLVAGDVFDVYNPPIEAEELFYDAMARLGDGGRRAVVVIAGNHDSPDRLSAPAPLSATHGVFILGLPSDAPHQIRNRGGRIQLLNSGPATLDIGLPSGERAVIAALPYPSEARLGDLLSKSLDEVDLQAAYSAKIASVFSELARAYRPDAVNLAMSHIAIATCQESESERTLIGGAYQVHASALPSAAHYCALGHLHLAQNVDDSPCKARYCGAPLAFRMSEKDYRRSFTFIDATADQPALVTEMPIQAGRDLVLWVADGGLEQVFFELEQGRFENAFIDLVVHSDTPLSQQELSQLRRSNRDFLRIRTLNPDTTEQLAQIVDRRTLPVRDLFEAFHQKERGAAPSPELTKLFLELADAARSEAQ